jgi:LysR family transcriptional regulator, hydrogen peroxide-inducible genes activator
MDMIQLSLRDLEYIVAVSEELHFGRAAQKLYVSQPTLSEQIKKMEENLEIKLFERTNRSVKLTPQGHELIEVARKVLKEAQLFIRLAKKKKHPLSGEFHLGAIATVGPYYLPYIIAPLRKSFPDLELIIHEGMTDDLLSKLDAGELNAVIASRTFDEDKYRVYSLYHEPFWLASPIDIELKIKNGRVSVKEIDESKLLLLTEGNCLKDEVLNFCGLPKNRSSYHKQSSSLDTLRYLVASGNGYTFFPELAIHEDRKLKSLIKYYPFIEKSAQREIVLVTREQYPKPDEIRLLYQKLKENLPEFKS